MNVRELLGKRMLFFDGGMGSMLQKNGMGAGEIPELLNLTNAALIEKIHTEYLEAGANIITTNTFGAKFSIRGKSAICCIRHRSLR